MACVVVSSKIGAEYTESSGVVMGSTGCSHPTVLQAKQLLLLFTFAENILEWNNACLQFVLNSK